LNKENASKIWKLIQETGDFLKGTERYKYDLGGDTVQLYDLTMEI